MKLFKMFKTAMTLKLISSNGRIAYDYTKLMEQLQAQ